jgi:hypothetical protein
MAASLAAGLHAVWCWRAALGVCCPGLQMQVNRTSTQWQSHPALRDMQAARRGRRGIPYAATWHSRPSAGSWQASTEVTMNIRSPRRQRGAASIEFARC